jgi:hypothetical protein
MELMNCPICRQTGTQRLFANVPDIDLKKCYPVAECTSCEVKRTIGVTEQISLLYANGEYRSSEKRRIVRFLKRCLHRMEVRRLIKAGVSNAFFDVGCGSGDLSRYLFEAGYSVAAADADPRRPVDIESYSDIPYQRFDYNTLTMEKPELLQGRTVILRHVLEHVRDPRKFLRQFADQGATYFYILAPDSSGLSRKLFGRYEALWGLPYHLWHFNLRSLKVLCESVGLKVVTSGHETVPVFLNSLQRYLLSNRAPAIFLRMFKADTFRTVLSLPFDLLLHHNVVYVVAKFEKNADVIERTS